MDLRTDRLIAENAALIDAGDIDALVARYAADAEILHQGGVARGTAQIREAFAEQRRAGAEVRETEIVARSQDAVVYRAAFGAAGSEVRVVGTIVLRDGLIWRQTTAVVG